MASESFYLKLLAMGIAGGGSIYLAVTGTISADAAVAILSAEVGFAVGEANGKMKAAK